MAVAHTFGKLLGFSGMKQEGRKSVWKESKSPSCTHSDIEGRVNVSHFVFRRRNYST